ncbi:transcriptional initiation protein Tat [Paraburkholderia bryophila]|uniref:thiosulfate dehydrogenase n=1 Tax=Burkholderiaceae TaxID=119060 RepID=UPI0005542F58|nr:hypothetical protein [Burkholderia sp. 9120]
MSTTLQGSKRRDVLRTMGFAALSVAALLPQRRAEAKEAHDIEMTSDLNGATTLAQLGKRLAAVPRRRNFESVPFMLTDRQYWDYDAAEQLLRYRHKARQVWENTDLAGPWPGLMREAMNGQVFANGDADFLAVSATHGLAHLALFAQPMWDKYNLAALAGPKFATNTLIVEKAGASRSDSTEDVAGFYGPANNNVTSLQRRGAVFIACHDSIHAISRAVQSSAGRPAASADKIAADLTNNLIPDAVLVPSVVSFMVDLQSRGFTYSKGG